MLNEAGYLVQFTGRPHPDYLESDVLWVLIGEEDNCNNGRCFYLGADRDFDGGECAALNFEKSLIDINKAGLKVTKQDLSVALDDYRQSERQAQEERG